MKWATFLLAILILLYLYNLTNPEIEWQYSFEQPAPGYHYSDNLIVKDKKIYCRCPKKIYCFSANGKLVNEYKVKGEISKYQVIKNSIIIFEDSGYCYCIDLFTKQIKWKKFYPNVGVPLATESDKLLFLCSDGYFYCIKCKTGELNWKIHTGIVLDHLSCPSFEKDTVYITTKGHLYKINSTTGDIYWRSKLYTTNKLCIGRKYLYVVAYNSLRCINKLSGKTEWTIDQIGPMKSEIKLKDQILYLNPSQTTGFTKVDTKTLKVYSLSYGGGITNSADVSKSFVCFFVDRFAYLLNKNDQLIWWQDVGNRITSTPKIVNKRLYIMTLEKVICLNLFRLSQQKKLYKTPWKLIKFPIQKF